MVKTAEAEIWSNKQSDVGCQWIRQPLLHLDAAGCSRVPLANGLIPKLLNELASILRGSKSTLWISCLVCCFYLMHKLQKSYNGKLHTHHECAISNIGQIKD